MPGAASATPRDDAPDALAGRRIVHLAGRADAAFVEQLAALTRALLARGVPQTVVLLEDARRRAPPACFAAGVRLVPVDASRWRAPRALWRALRAELRHERTAVVHAHGWLPCLLGILAARFLDLPAPLHLSLHGRRARPLPERALAMLWRAAASPAAPAATLRADWPDVDVGEAFFGARRRESPRPLVVTSRRAPDAPHAARFAQLAVLLQSAAIDFHWLGPADDASAAQFAAAGVVQVEPRGDARRAARLRSAWVYLDSGGAEALAELAEAMAVGLPCLALDGAAYRALLEHGRTGLLCDSDDDLLAALAQLVDSAELRARLGAAARVQASARFSRAGRSEALLAAYRAAAAEVVGPATAAPGSATDLPLASPDR